MRTVSVVEVPSTAATTSSGEIGRPSYLLIAHVGLAPGQAAQDVGKLAGEVLLDHDHAR